MPTISQELLNECAGLIYDKWAKAYDNRKMVAIEKSDGSEDWELFHRERLRRALDVEARAIAFLNEITPLHTVGK